jgi:hypothetical protein
MLVGAHLQCYGRLFQTRAATETATIQVDIGRHCEAVQGFVKKTLGRAIGAMLFDVDCYSSNKAADEHQNMKIRPRPRWRFHYYP